MENHDIPQACSQFDKKADHIFRRIQQVLEEELGDGPVRFSLFVITKDGDKVGFSHLANIGQAECIKMMRELVVTHDLYDAAIPNSTQH